MKYQTENVLVGGINYLSHSLIAIDGGYHNGLNVIVGTMWRISILGAMVCLIRQIIGVANLAKEN